MTDKKDTKKDDDKTIDEMIRIYKKRGDNEQVVSCYKKLLEKHPGSTDILDGLALGYRAQNQPEIEDYYGYEEYYGCGYGLDITGDNWELDPGKDVAGETIEDYSDEEITGDCMWAMAYFMRD